MLVGAVRVQENARPVIEGAEVKRYLLANRMTAASGKLNIPGHSPLSWPPDQRLYEEAATLAVSFLLQTIRPKIVYDIGAAEGYFSRVAASHIDAHPIVHAFELRPNCLAVMGEALDRDHLSGRVIVRAAALSERHEGKRHIWFCGMKLFEREPHPHEWEPSVWQRLRLALNGRSKPLVKTRVLLTSIDHLAAEHGIVPDLIKIDVDGYEGRVLRGGMQVLASRRPAIALELHKDEKIRFGDNRRTVVAMLTRIGYRAFFLTDHQNRKACGVVPVDETHPLVARQETDFLLLY